MRIIERAGVGVIVRFANLRIQLDILSVAQVGQRLTFACIERDLGARLPVKLQNEALAFALNRRRLDHASAKNHDFARLRIDLGRRPWIVRGSRPDAREDQPQTAADACEDARSAQARNDTQSKKRADDQRRFGFREGSEAGYKDS